MNCLVRKKKSHIYSLFKEMEYEINSCKDFFTKNYLIKESVYRLPKFEQYYKHYLTFLSRPYISNIYFNELLRENSKQKAQIYFDYNYGIKKENIKEEKNELKEIIFNADIRETLENYSTTMTYDSNEQLIYPIEIYNKCRNDYRNNSSCKNMNFSQSEIVNLNKDYINQNNNDFDNNESLVNIINDLKKKSRSKEKEIKKKIEEPNKSNYKEKKRSLQKYKTQIGIKNRDHSKEKNFILTNNNYNKSKTRDLNNIYTSNIKKISYININQEEKKKELEQKKKLINKSQSINNNLNKISESNTTKSNNRYLMNEIQQKNFINLKQSLNLQNYTSEYKRKTLLNLNIDIKNQNNNNYNLSISARNKQAKQNEIFNRLNKEKSKGKKASYSKSPNKKVLKINPFNTISESIEIKKIDNKKKIEKLNSHNKLLTAPSFSSNYQLVNSTKNNNIQINFIPNKNNNYSIQKFKYKDIYKKKLENK